MSSEIVCNPNEILTVIFKDIVLNHSQSSNSHIPFFIMGCPRSGTSLVARILDSHSQLAVYFETQYYPTFYSEINYYGSLHKKTNLKYFISNFFKCIRMQGGTPPSIKEFLEELKVYTFEEILTTFLGMYANNQGKKRGGEKTPGHYLYVENFLDKFPSSPIIFIIRDPRDTVLSMHKAFGTSVKGAAHQWNESFEHFKKVSSKVHLLRYEELVKNPARETKIMCSYMGENYEPNMLDFFEKTSERVEFRNHLQKLLVPVDSNSVGNFKEMQDHDIKTIESICHEGMKFLGYHLCYEVKKEKIRNTSSNFLIDKLVYYNWNLRRWQRGWFRWKMKFFVRMRYWVITLQKK